MNPAAIGLDDASQKPRFPMILSKPQKIIIAAMSRDGLIGRGEGMPWDVPAEYQQFLSFVNRQTVMMGRRTFQIFGGDLQTSHNLVVSRSIRELAGAEVFADIDQAMERGIALGKTIFVAGGATIYRQMLPQVDQMYLSVIHGDYQGDTFFPDFEASDWHVAARQENELFDFSIYQRKNT